MRLAATLARNALRHHPAAPAAARGPAPARRHPPAPADRARRRRRHRQHRQRHVLRRTRPRPQRRRRLRRPPRPRLRRLLRHRRLLLRHPHRLPGHAPLVRRLGPPRLPRPRRENEPGRPRPRPLHPQLLARPPLRSPRRRLLRHPLRCPHPASPRRLPRHRHLGLRRDRAHRGPQPRWPHQRRRRAQRRPGAAHLQLQFRRRLHALLLCRPRPRRPPDLRLHPACATAASAAPGWPSAKTKPRPARWA